MNKDEHHMSRFHRAISMASTFFARASLCLKKYTSHDKHWVIIILLLSALLRIPFLNHPDRTVFDETFYTNFATHIVHQEPFFDIHPPLARIIFAGIASNSSLLLSGVPLETNKQFGDFPYTTLRLFIALIGTLLPLLLYLTGRLLKYSPREAGVLALFAVFDNALVIYSRLILPDTLLLFLNFLGFAAALAAVQVVNQKKYQVLLILLSGIAIGLAIAIKWTALAMLPIIWIVFLFARMYRAIFTTGVLVVLSYFFVFVFYFTHFPEGGRVDPALYYYNNSIIAGMTFPKGTHIKDIVDYLPQIHERMLHANDDPNIATYAAPAEGPLSWLTTNALPFWISDNGKMRITLQGNTYLWFLILFMIMFELGWIVTQGRIKKTWPIDKTETILLLGYIVNYVPFFLIDRPMYLYHYFTAFIFLLLLLPRVTPRIIDCIHHITHDRMFAKAIMYYGILLVFINFFLAARTTYGL